MYQPGRKFSENSYKYGFNGKEKDDEVYSATGTSYDYGFRIYNPRLGRFLSVDPKFLSYPWLSNYQFAENQPIWAIDLDGSEKNIIIRYYTEGFNYKTTIIKVPKEKRLDKYKDSGILIIESGPNQIRASSIERNLKDFIGNYIDKITTDKSKVSPSEQKYIDLLENQKQSPSGNVIYSPLITIEVSFSVDKSNETEFRSNLTKESKENLEKVAKILVSKNIDVKVTIKGHASNTKTPPGTDPAEHNLRLSQERAETAKTYLLSYIRDVLKVSDFDESKIAAYGAGTDEPKDTSNPGSPDNQRVTITLVITDIKPAE